MGVMTKQIKTVVLGSEEGLVLRGQFPGSFCFVPLTCAEIGADGAVHVPRARYLMSTWARRNVRLNPGRTVGSHLFPEERARQLSPSEPQVRQFIALAQSLATK